jgi:hypothetical protein
MSDRFELDNYLTSERDCFNIYIESSFHASCTSVEYKLELLDMVKDMLNDTREQLIQERDEEDTDETIVENKKELVLPLDDKAVFQEKIEQTTFSSSNAKNELLQMSESYSSHPSGYNFGNYGMYFHRTDIVECRMIYIIYSYEELFEYNEEDGFTVYEANLKKQLFEIIRFQHVTIDDFLEFMKIAIDIL